MKKFKFQLDSLLKIRKIEEDKAHALMRQAVESRQKAQQLLNQFQREQEYNHQKFREQQQSSRSVYVMMNYIYYLDKLEQQVNEQVKVVSKAEQDEEQCRIQLQEATRQRKIVEKLREKKLEQYHHELLKEEQNFLDEIGTQRFKGFSL